MSRAAYLYDGVNSTKKIVFIIDLDRGMSVTNDAESVVTEVNDRYPGHRIVYQDTMGNTDELLHTNGKFEGFAPYRK